MIEPIVKNAAAKKKVSSNGKHPVFIFLTEKSWNPRLRLFISTFFFLKEKNLPFYLWEKNGGCPVPLSPWKNRPLFFGKYMGKNPARQTRWIVFYQDTKNPPPRTGTTMSVGFPFHYLSPQRRSLSTWTPFKRLLFLSLTKPFFKQCSVFSLSRPHCLCLNKRK